MTIDPRLRREQLLIELRELISRYAHRGDLPIPGLQVFSTDTVTEPASVLAEASLAFVAQGAKQIVIGEHVLDYGPGDYLIVSVDLPVTGQFTVASPEEPFLGVGMTIDPAALASLLLESAAQLPQVRSAEARGPALATSSASTELLDALARLLRLLDAPGDRDVLAPTVQREILWRLLSGPQGSLVRQIGTVTSSLAHVADAVRWIRGNFAEPFRVEDLAAEVAMSPSTFHRHFRTATTMGPIQFQKKIRLQQARLLLLGSAMDVTRAAFAVGYESSSQFSREYRREFGVAPSHETADRQPA